jgi:hypothetical protein
VVAEFFIEHLQDMRALRQRVEVDALGDRHQGAGSLGARWTTLLHGGTYSANSQ